MPKPLRRLTLRLTTDNPIFDVPAGERNKKAEELLRIGTDIERLENVAKQLERLTSSLKTKGPVIEQEKQEEIEEIEDPRNDPNFQRDMKLIQSIMKMGDKT